MAPSRRKTSTRANPTRVIITRSIYKKLQQEANNKLKGLSNSSGKEGADSAKSTSSTSNIDEEILIRSTRENDVVCSTPRGKKYMIPKISTCPPAPKKKRLVLNQSRAAATKFFSHPELDVFFLFSSPPNSIHTLDSNQARLF